MNVPVPVPNTPIAEQEPLTLLAMCLFGESRGEPDQAKVAVGCVVRNRLALAPKFGVGWAGVILKPWQFSCFNENNPNREKLLAPLRYEAHSVWASCYLAAQRVYTENCPDLTASALFYHDDTMQDAPPAWGPCEKTAQLGRLTFYRPSRDQQ